jgi:F420-dependent oxidoreductase-like protein
VPFASPLGRTREYVDIVKLAIARKPVAYDGEHYTLPLPDGPGKALRLGFHPPRAAVPIYLAAVGPKNLELAGEIADGWLAIFFAPDAAGEYLQHIERGRASRGLGLTGFDVAPTAPVVIGDDVARCADVIRPYAALYVGGMGSREQNFYNQLAVRMGYADEAATVQDLYLAGQKAEAAAAVPHDFIERTSLLGNKIQITERIRQYAAAGVGTLSISPYVGDRAGGLETLRLVASAFDDAGVAG